MEKREVTRMKDLKEQAKEQRGKPEAAMAESGASHGENHESVSRDLQGDD